MIDHDWSGAFSPRRTIMTRRRTKKKAECSSEHDTIMNEDWIDEIINTKKKTSLSNMVLRSQVLLMVILSFSDISLVIYTIIIFEFIENFWDSICVV